MAVFHHIDLHCVADCQNNLNLTALMALCDLDNLKLFPSCNSKGKTTALLVFDSVSQVSFLKNIDFKLEMEVNRVLQSHVFVKTEMSNQPALLTP